MNMLQCDDVLNLILKQSENCYCAIVCKKWQTLLLASSDICVTCNKFSKIYDIELWDKNSKCHIKPLFIKINSLVSFDTKYVRCISETLKALESISENMYIIINIKTLIIKLENFNKTIFAKLYIERPMTRTEYVSMQSNNISIGIKVNTKEFIKSFENSDVLTLNAYIGTKQYFENTDKDDNYLTVNSAYSKTTNFKSLKLCNESTCEYDSGIPVNYAPNKNVNKNDYALLTTLPQCITNIDIFTNNMGNVFTKCRVTTIGNLTLSF